VWFLKGSKTPGSQKPISCRSKHPIKCSAYGYECDEVNDGVPSISSGKMKRRTCYECGENWKGTHFYGLPKEANYWSKRFQYKLNKWFSKFVFLFWFTHLGKEICLLYIFAGVSMNSSIICFGPVIGTSCYIVVFQVNLLNQLNWMHWIITWIFLLIQNQNSLLIS
jgi:hypothetical protein